ncbi:MAG: hypothetical protein ACRDHO_13015 [Actinomycetota bacterium]
MTRASRSLRILILAGTALAGLVGAHLLDYFLVLPDATSRHAVLAETGHGYMGLAIWLAVASAIMAGVTSIALGLRRGAGRAGEPLAFGSLAWRLVALQPAGFLVLELVERMAAGVPAHHYLDPIIAVGVLLQAIVALIGAAILVVLARGGELLGKVLSRNERFERTGSGFGPRLEVSLLGRRLSLPGPIRAPPALLAPLP